MFTLMTCFLIFKYQLFMFYTNHGEKLSHIPKGLTLSELIAAAARGAAVLPDMALRVEGVTNWLLPENRRMVDAADLYQAQYDARAKVRDVKIKIQEYAKYFEK